MDDPSTLEGECLHYISASGLGRSSAILRPEIFRFSIREYNGILYSLTDKMGPLLFSVFSFVVVNHSSLTHVFSKSSCLD